MEQDVVDEVQQVQLRRVLLRSQHAVPHDAREVSCAVRVLCDPLLAVLRDTHAGCAETTPHSYGGARQHHRTRMVSFVPLIEDMML